MDQFIFLFVHISKNESLELHLILFYSNNMLLLTNLEFIVHANSHIFSAMLPSPSSLYLPILPYLKENESNFNVISIILKLFYKNKIQLKQNNIYMHTV